MSRATHIFKWYCYKGTVNDDPALIQVSYDLYAHIPKGWQTIETADSFVGILNEYTGESRDLVWETVPENASFKIDRPSF